MLKITIREARKALKDIVAEKGSDFRYDENTCVYAKDNAPSCGVGLALDKCGVPLTVIADLDHTGFDTSFKSDGVQETLLTNGIVVTDAAKRVLTRFQYEQDSRQPYGEALKSALRQAR